MLSLRRRLRSRLQTSLESFKQCRCGPAPAILETCRYQNLGFTICARVDAIGYRRVLNLRKFYFGLKLRLPNVRCQIHSVGLLKISLTGGPHKSQTARRRNRVEKHVWWHRFGCSTCAQRLNIRIASARATSAHFPHKAFVRLPRTAAAWVTFHRFQTFRHGA